MYNWCKILEKVILVKKSYKYLFGDYGNYNFEEWLAHIKKNGGMDITDIFEPLQINQHGDLLLIRYGLAEMQQMGDMWENKESIYRDCRSIVLDIREERVVQAPFKKFFNLNEVEENSIENISKEIENAEFVEITNKLDGSMQCASEYKGDILLTGSMALTPSASWRVEEGYKMLDDNTRNMILENTAYTFIFEFIHTKDVHVVVYSEGENGLYLIGIRNRETGEELSYSQVKEFAQKYNVKMVEIENLSFEQILEYTKVYKSNEKEGWVMNIDGHRVKVKCDDYVNLHRCLDKISSVNVVIKAIAEDTYDDLLSKLPVCYHDRVKKIATLVFNYKITKEKEIRDYYNALIKYCFAEVVDNMKWIDENVPKSDRGYVRNLYFGQEINVIKMRYRCKKLSEMGIDLRISNIFEE